jgi:wobble nucleotide-excising tRNase
VISRIRLVRNLGQFDSVDAGAQLPLQMLTLMYAENGRGKTTMAAVLRSLATGDELAIASAPASRRPTRRTW